MLLLKPRGFDGKDFLLRCRHKGLEIERLVTLEKKKNGVVSACRARRVQMYDACPRERDFISFPSLRGLFPSMMRSYYSKTTERMRADPTVSVGTMADGKYGGSARMWQATS